MLSKSLVTCKHAFPLGPLFLLVEFAANGNLRHFLYNHRPDQLKTSDYLLPSINGTIPSMPKVTLTCAHLISFCYQVAKGMDYIASKNVSSFILLNLRKIASKNVSSFVLLNLHNIASKKVSSFVLLNFFFCVL